MGPLDRMEHGTEFLPVNSPRWFNSEGHILHNVAALVLGSLLSGTGLLIAQAGEVRYNVIKIIEGTGTTAPEAGGINQKGQAVGFIISMRS